MNMEYEATPLGRPSPEGLEAVELFPWRPSEFPGKKPAFGRARQCYSRDFFRNLPRRNPNLPVRR
jgi:hypothetical protein